MKALLGLIMFGRRSQPGSDPGLRSRRDREARPLLQLSIVVALVAACVFAVVPGALAQRDRDPIPGQVKTITQADCAQGCTVPAGQVWQFDPTKTTAITSTANIIVKGTLRMRPASKSVVHTLTFTGINESKFKGGGSVPVASDVGLWVVDAGQLDIHGSERTSWSYAWAADWTSGDTIVAAPNAPGDYGNFRTITSAAGVPAANTHGYKTELLNLTRNVRIQGTAAGKSHIFVKSTKPQVVKHAELRFMSPDFLGYDPRTGRSDDKTGRYALHFHLSGAGSVGSVVEGVLIRDADGHAFVPHGSHGVTFKDTIAFDTRAEAYWWDESTGDVCPANDRDCNASHNIRYICAIAARTTTHSAGKHTGAAFQLGAGLNNSITESVAVGFQGGGKDNAGYKWPSSDHGVWNFAGNKAHNNNAAGIFVWHNSTGEANLNHVIDGYVAYNNGDVAIDHGAYNNSYLYKNLKLRGNGEPVILSLALGKPSATSNPAKGATDTQIWWGVEAGDGWLVPANHKPDPGDTVPVRFLRCNVAGVRFNEANYPGVYDFVECGLKLSDFDRAKINAQTVVRVQDGSTAYTFTGKGSSRTIARFYTGTTQLPPPPNLTPPPPVPLPPPGGGASGGGRGRD